MIESVLKEDEYRDEATGEILCRFCHHARRKTISCLGVEKEVSILCPCQEEKYEKETAEKKQQDFMDLVQRHRSVGMAEKALREYTFANDKGYNQQIEIAKNYVKHWENMLENGRGLLFWGGVGTGKTFLAGCIANALLEKGVRVMMTNFQRILNDLADFSGRNGKTDNLNRYPLLILDDLGVERSTGYVSEQMFSIIDSRYRSGLPMIITTNLTLEEMRTTADPDRKRIYDRILHHSIPVCVNGQNIRQQEAAENMKAAKVLLKGEEQPAVSRT